MVDLTLASPTCSTCRGSGWDSAHDRACRCVRRADASGAELDASPDRISETARDLLEIDVRRILIDARSPSAISDAKGLARCVARGDLPPTVEAVMVYARVREVAARRVFRRVRLAVQTKKKGINQCQ